MTKEKKAIIKINWGKAVPIIIGVLVSAAITTKILIWLIS